MYGHDSVHRTKENISIHKEPKKIKFYFNYKNTDNGIEVDVCAECIDYWVEGKLYCICLVGKEAEHGAEEDNLKEMTSMLFLQQSTE